ncbi:MAG: PA14 domain-containing protein [Caldilineaceae bacterium]|nr:PA14 domain-containing protein [Caldilineaceae bacterium]
MSSDSLPTFWIRRWQSGIIAAALLLSFLSQAAVAGTTDTFEHEINCASIHTVTAGETLTGIALRTGVSLSALAEANHLSTTAQVLIGQRLCVPRTISAASPVAPAPPVAPAAPVVPAPTARTGTAANWTGKYYNNQDLSGDPVLTRQDASIDFNWQSGSPDTSIASDSFSVSWTANVTFETAAYRFTAVADDGVRVYVDDTLVLEDWNVHPATTTVRDTEITAGSHTVKVEYFEASGAASISVSWEKQVEETPTCNVQPHDSLSSFWTHSSLGCASAAAATVWAAWQPFESGHMIWRQNDDAVYVYADGGNWARHSDDWNDQALSNNRGAAPAGLQSPVRGFGYLWETNDDVYNDLGWAAADEKGFCARIQQFAKGTLLIADTAATCRENSHNFASETFVAKNVLQALTGGEWTLVCEKQTHEKLEPYWNQDDVGCPLSTGATLWTAWQPFEKGYMLWRQDDDAVFVFTDENEWARYSDDWDSQAYEPARGAEPADRHTPVRGFGYLWATNDDVFADLGWATDVEKGACTLIQAFDGGTLLTGDPVDSCFDGADNLVSDTLLGSSTIEALESGSWEIACVNPVHAGLDHLWDHTEFGCPQAAGGILWSSWQPFQTGHMIWRENDDAVFVFANGQDAERFADDWNDQTYSTNRGTPPEGLQAPERGFGYLWENDDDVYGDLGWAAADERGFCALFQQYEKGYLIVSSSVPSCKDGQNNEATEIDFALHSLSVLNDGTWTLR